MKVRVRRVKTREDGISEGRNRKRKKKISKQCRDFKPGLDSHLKPYCVKRRPGFQTKIYRES